MYIFLYSAAISLLHKIDSMVVEFWEIIFVLALLHEVGKVHLLIKSYSQAILLGTFSLMIFIGVDFFNYSVRKRALILLIKLGQEEILIKILKVILVFNIYL